MPVDPADHDSPDRQRGRWMAAGQAGDRCAYERVLAAAVPLVRAVARRQGVPEAQLDDVVQETLLTVHRVRHTYDPARSFDAWLTALAARRAIDLLRAEGRRARRELHDPAAAERHAAPDDASRERERDERARRLREAVATLPPGQRQAIEELAFAERSLAEASARTGRRPGALKVNLHRALKALRGKLDGDADG